MVMRTPRSATILVPSGNGMMRFAIREQRLSAIIASIGRNQAFVCTLSPPSGNHSDGLARERIIQLIE
jgi:hypothetical protein